VFIVLEGIDGCGKSTQARLLADRLRAAGHDVVTTREPGGTEAGAVIRSLVLAGADLDPRTEALLIAADRAEHVARVVRPALERGAVVVSDRYIPSSLAYQGAGRGLGTPIIDEISQWATGGLAPDVVVVLEVSPEVAVARRGAPRDRLESEDDEFRAAVARGYRELAAARGWALVDGEPSEETVAAQVWKAVEPVVAR
jgi:dTMP kinase